MALSVASSERRSLVSCLKSSDIRTPRRVRFQLPSDFRNIVLDFKNKVNVKAYEDLVCIIRNSDVQDSDLQDLLHKTRENISLLNHSVYHLVHVILKLKWANRGQGAVKEYQGFLVDLLCAHNYYMKNVLDELVQTFKADNGWENQAPTEEAKLVSDHVHEVLQVLLQIIPMSSNLLKESIDAHFPYLRRSAQEHELYLYNILRILEYKPVLRTDFLFLIINRLIILDVNAPKHEIEEFADVGEQFDMDLSSEDTHGDMTHQIANTLDHAMCILFQYVHDTCFDQSLSPPELEWEKTKKLFEEVVNVFDNLVLPTHATHHVQFIIFYMCKFRLFLADSFISYLWQKVTSTRVASSVRQTAVAYIGSLLGRAAYISVKMLMKQMLEMTAWIHNYITNQDGIECHTDVRIHPVFYSVCQAVFYVIVSRYRELVKTKKGLLFLQSLNLTNIVTSNLNPLKVCLPSIVYNFAAVTKNYQLAYCYTILEQNSRTNLPVVHLNDQGVVYDTPEKEILDTFFPFDPYVLKRSKTFFSEDYLNSQVPSFEDRADVMDHKQDDNDDFLSDYTAGSSAVPILGLSPNF